MVRSVVNYLPSRLQTLIVVPFPCSLSLPDFSTRLLSSLHHYNWDFLDFFKYDSRVDKFEQSSLTLSLSLSNCSTYSFASSCGELTLVRTNISKAPYIPKHHPAYLAMATDAIAPGNDALLQTVTSSEARHRKKSVIEVAGSDGNRRVINLEEMNNADAQLAAQFGYKPVFKREFGYLSTFSFAVSISGLFSTIMTTFTYPITAGGSAAVVWDWAISGAGCMCIAVRPSMDIPKRLNTNPLS